MADPEKPVWVLRRELVRKAKERVRGRRDFERHVGRESVLPLVIEVNCVDLLRVLDEEVPS